MSPIRCRLIYHLRYYDVCTRNFDKVLLGAYRWLSQNYQENDRIYLVGKSPFCSYFIPKLKHLQGFSRGAYQVRALAGMIETVCIPFLV